MTAETGNTINAAVNQQAIIVSQPKKLEGLLDTISLLNSVSERIGEDSSKDLGSGGGASGGQGDDDDGQQTWRDDAIANLPSAPVMQSKLQTHITKEIKGVRGTIKNSSKNIGKPGSPVASTNSMHAFGD